MPVYTTNYGAINEIAFSRPPYTYTDSTGTNFAFEVIPINISASEINQIKTTVYPENTSRYWFISFDTKLIIPTDADINTALLQGSIITLTMSGIVIDNYGFKHLIEYDTTLNKYKINQSSLLRVKYIINYPEVQPLSNALIDCIKITGNPYQPLSSFNNYYKTIFTRLLEGLNSVDQNVSSLLFTIQSLEERIQALENR